MQQTKKTSSFGIVFKATLRSGSMKFGQDVAVKIFIEEEEKLKTINITIMKEVNILFNLERKIGSTEQITHVDRIVVGQLPRSFQAVLGKHNKYGIGIFMRLEVGGSLSKHFKSCIPIRKKWTSCRPIRKKWASCIPLATADSSSRA